MDDKDKLIERLILKMNTAVHLLNRAAPYINQHYEKSVYGHNAKKLLDEIQAFQDSVILGDR